LISEQLFTCKLYDVTYLWIWMCNQLTRLWTVWTFRTTTNTARTQDDA